MSGYDVTPQEFEARVIRRSHEIPVLVDFWAPWCGPCRTLGPTLEEIATERAGRLELVKVNTEAHPELGARFQIRSIPAVKLFRDGAVVDEFVGAMPAPEVRRFLDRNQPSATDALVKEAAAKAAGGDRDAARGLLEAALVAEPAHPGARLARARLALSDRDPELALAHLDHVPPTANEALEAGALRAFAGLLAACHGAGGGAACQARLAADPRDEEARFQLGACLAMDGRYREALEALLEVLERPKAPLRTEAHRAVLAIFGLLGRRDPVVDEYERRLQILL